MAIKPLHIALNGWFWESPTTGSGQYLRGLVDGLLSLSADLRLTLILPNAPKHPAPDGLEIHVQRPIIGGNLGKVWFEQRSFPAAIKAIKADIAHVPYWGPPLSSPARLIVSVLDVIPLALSQYRGGLLGNLYTSLVTAGAAGAGHILTLSEASKAEIIEHLKVSAEKITVTHLAADGRFHLGANPAQDEAVRRKYDLPDEFALYLGGFDIRKNVNTLLLAWTYVGGPMGEFVPLVLAGKPPDAWGTAVFPDLPKYAQDLNLGAKVIWTGEIDEADKPALYRLAKVFIWPSLYEGFGLPPLEAMASGIPVVAAEATSTPEIVGDAAYLVDAKNPRDMAGAILAVMVQPDLHAHLVNLGRGQATRFSWRKTAQQTLAAYQQIMDA